MKGFLSALKCEKEDARDKIYPRPSLPQEEIRKRGFYSRPPQVSCNCVLANHDVGLHIRLGMRDLYEWLKAREDHIIGWYQPSTQQEFFLPDEYSLSNEEKELQALFLEAKELERNIERRNLPLALKKYREAAEKGHIEAQFRVGLFLLRGMGCDQIDEVEAKKFLNSAAEKGWPDAKAYLAYSTKPSDRGYDRKELLEALDLAAEQGSLYGAFF